MLRYERYFSSLMAASLAEVALAAAREAIPVSSISQPEFPGPDGGPHGLFGRLQAAPQTGTN